jgi:subfamily B ATP-binding cassette protein MsbA
VAAESLANAPLVQSLNRQDTEVERFRRENEGIMEAELAATRVRSLFDPLVSLIELLGAMIVVGLGVWALTAGDLSLGGLLVFLAYLSQLYRPVRDLSDLAASLFAASAGAERVIELLDERPSVEDHPDARALSAVRGHVELRRVGYRYPGAERDALRGLSLRVEPGETVAFVGPSGAGKSTVARLLLRFADPGEGSVLLDGHDLRQLALHSVREHVALLLQEPLLLDASVRDNLAYGREGAGDAEIEAAACAAGVHELIAALPDGYDTRIGPNGQRLSGGQRQRLAIARTLLRDAAVVVLDEPTTGLDAAARDGVLQGIEELRRGRTTLIVSHDPEVIARADRVVRLEAGRPALEAAAA